MAPGEPGYPLSPQQAAAFRSRFGDGAATATIRVSGPLDEARLRSAFSSLVRRYEILRTRVEAVDGLDLPLQFIDAPDGPGAIEIDLSAAGRDEHDVRLRTTCLHADATTFQRIVEELAVAYAGPPAPDDPPPLQYADYARWAVDLREDAEGEPGRQFWQSFLPEAGSSAPARIGGMAVVAGVVPASATATELLATWLLLWGTRENAERVAISVRGDGRQHLELRDAIGPLERWLPIGDVAVGPASTLAGVCRDLDQRVAAAVQHQDYWPDCHGPATAMGFAYSRWPAVRAAGVAWRVTETWRACEACPLTLTVIAGDGATRVQVAYDPARWRPADAARLLAQYTALVARGASAATTPRRDWIVGPRPPSPPPAPAAADVLARLSAYAAAQPAQVAVTCAGRAWTYATLTAHAAALAARVRPAGPEARIGLVLERSVEAVAAWLGLLAAGVVAVPLDPAAPPARLAALGAQCRLQAVVTSRALAPTLPAALGPPLLVDAAPAGAGPAPLHGPAPARLAYLLFTSGSTGTPKGVAVSHGALAHYAAALTARLAPPAGATWALVSPLTADLGYTSLLGALTTGGTLCWSTADEATDPGALAAADYLKITPTHLAALLRAATPPARVLPRRALLLGGEALSWALTEQLAALAPALPVVNHYGPTETTIGVLMGPAPPEPAPRPATPPLGTPLPHVAAYLLDATLAPVLDGAPGTLWIGGPALARGYDHAPALTAARFRPDPFAAAGARMYDTGDRARRTADGALEFLGRTDRQLKLRGHRIEPAEVEAVLRTHPAVAHAVVLPTPPDAPAALAAFVAVAPEAGGVARLLRVDATQLPQGSSLFDLPNGLTIAHQNAWMTRFVYHEIFEELSYLRHGITLESDATVIDVGANIGLFTLLAATLQPGARIIAVEPMPSTCALLRINASIWAPRAVVEQCGLSDAPGRARFTHYPDFSGASGMFADAARDTASLQALARLQFRHGAGGAGNGARNGAGDGARNGAGDGARNGAGDGAGNGAGDGADAAYVSEALEGRWRSEPVSAPVKTVSQLIRQHGLARVDLLKIDAEMSELKILQGIDDADWPRIRQVAIEAHGEELRRETARVLQGKGLEVHCDQISAYRGSEVFQVCAIRPSMAAPRAPGRTAPQRLGAPGLIEELHQHLRQALPEPMRPASLRLLAEFPRTPSGKVDLRALSAMPADEPAAAAYEEPGSPLERAIARQWSELLGRPRVGAADNFFALGGHSLLAIQSLSRLRSMLQLEIPLRFIFDAATPRALAAAVVGIEGAPGHAQRAAAIWLDIETMSATEIESALEGS